VGKLREELLSKNSPTHSGHDDISQKQVNMRVLLAADLQRNSSIAGFEYGMGAPQ
jgi:hypothetical protein